MPWQKLIGIAPKQFCCGHRGFNVANNKGYSHDRYKDIIYICPNCDKPTFLDFL